ncbi:MAG: TetR/AcrR family transcriptional regulator, partial [Bacilli bacterium]|nr:TetR/AcrR family transcriptional regulator [Bacilli bacterium]
MDRRINKTKQIMKEALTTLLEQKDIRKITVKELSQLANINRGTFYLHYMDIYDMVDQLGNEIINEISAIIEKNNALHMGAFYIPILVKIVEYLNQDMRFCKVLIGPNGDLGFLEKLKKTMMNQTYRTYKNVQLNHDQTFLR